MNKALILPAILLAACGNETASQSTQKAAADGAPAPAAPAADAMTDEAMSDCPVIDSREWTAWIDAEPPGPARLHIRGQVDLPTPGYTAAWREGIADRMMPPGVRYHLSLTPPDGMVAQVITSEDVAFEGAATYPEYRVITVYCGDEKLGEITEIPTAY